VSYTDWLFVYVLVVSVAILVALAWLYLYTGGGLEKRRRGGEARVHAGPPDPNGRQWLYIESDERVE
jgi:hypothetical protein